MWIPPGQKVLQNGNAECPREQSRVEACEKAKRYKRRAQELQERCRKGRGNRRREVHPGDFPSKYPGSAVLEVREASFQFMQAVDVEDHGSGRCAENEMPENCRGTFQVRIQ